MAKIWKVAKYEYTHHVLTKRFWIALFAVPLVFIGFSFISMVIGIKSVDTRPLGVIDQAGIIIQPQKLKEKPGFFDIQFEILPFADEATALKATEAEEIQGFIIIPEDYEAYYHLTWKSNKSLPADVKAPILQYISENLLAAENIPHLTRIQEGTNFKLESLDGSIKSDGASWQRILIPALLSILYFILVMSSGSYLLQSLVEEKENRTIEIMLTTVSHNQLMAGKIIGNIGVGITQLMIWVILAMVALFAFRARIPFLSELQIAPGMLTLSLTFMLVSFVFTAAVLAIFGATMTESQEAQQMIGLMVFPVLLPLYFMSSFMNAANGVIAKIMSYIPFSSPIAISLRMAFTKLPSIEIVFVLFVQVLLAIGAIWLAGRAFKAGMLRYHKRVKLAELFRKEASDA